ncbi:MAG: DUF6491 family protein [Sphingosinicella sp.]|uniref:DUF6491 family protein n=1 Tax=Sphingosinicella sp. TaxID=1917971 RepID=UPI004037BA9E
MIRILVLPLALSALGAIALTDAREGLAQDRGWSPAGDCFNAGTVNSFTPEGDRAVVVRVSRNRQYRLELVGYCPDVDWSLRIALRARGGSNWVCAGGDAEILVPSTTGPQNCLVTAVNRLTPEEIEARRNR